MSITEVIEYTQDSIRLGVVGTELDSVRTRYERDLAVRVYEDGCVGLAAATGAADLDLLTSQARAALALGVPHAPGPAGEAEGASATSGRVFSPEQLVEYAGGILERLRDRHPEVLLSNSIAWERTVLRIRNDLGLDLAHVSTGTGLELVAKVKGSPNAFDTLLVAQGRDLQADAVVAWADAHLAAFGNALGSAPTGRCKVVMAGLEAPVAQLLRSDALARTYHSGASVFSGRLGQRIFDPRVTIHDVRDPARWHARPFDMEGTRRGDLAIVDAGHLAHLAADRREAHRFGQEPTASAEGPVHELPGTALGQLRLAPTAPTLAQLLDGEPAILVWGTIGGDCTRKGDVAMPVQIAMQLDGQGNAVGRLPDLTLTGNLFELLGDGFVGASEERHAPWADDGWVVTHMESHPQ